MQAEVHSDVVSAESLQALHTVLALQKDINGHLPKSNTPTDLNATSTPLLCGLGFPSSFQAYFCAASALLALHVSTARLTGHCFATTGRAGTCVADWCMLYKCKGGMTQTYVSWTENFIR